jgi:hypothetical protein
MNMQSTTIIRTMEKITHFEETEKNLCEMFSLINKIKDVIIFSGKGRFKAT